jgi:Reverse transcriptase (RNA-dependent DNA polymerase)
MFAPVVKFASLRTVLALAAEYDLEVHQLDVKSAYLNGDLKEEIYMAPPPGFDTPEGIVLKLKRAIYGTKQGGRAWYEHIKSTLKSMGYARTNADHAIFTHLKDETLSIIALYVDDITMACKSLKTINEDKEKLKKTYQMTDLGEITWILEMHVTRDRDAGWITLSQERYINNVLECLGKANVRPISTPAVPNEHLLKLDSPETNVKAYQSAIRALMYPMLGTRPNLAHTVATLRRRQPR